MRLDSPNRDKKYNCYGVIFDGGITVVQESKVTKGTCTVKFMVDSPSIMFESTRPRPAWVVEAKYIEIEGPELDSKATGDKTPGIESAKTFALANLEQPIRFVKLDNLIRGNFNRSSLDENELLNQMSKLLIGKARGTSATDAGVYLQELFEVSMSELDFQKEKIMKQTGCRVSVAPTGRGTQLELRAWPGVAPDARDVDLLSDDLPFRFFVIDHPRLNSSTLLDHPIRGRETLGWEINVIKSSAAPVVGVIADSFRNREDILSFVGEASDVTLQPIIDDILGLRARKAIREVEQEAAMEEGLDYNEVSEHLDPTKSLSKLPLDSLFSAGKPVLTSEELGHSKAAATMEPRPQNSTSGGSQVVNKAQRKCNSWATRNR